MMIDVTDFVKFLLNNNMTERMYITLFLMNTSNKKLLNDYKKLNKQFNPSLLTKSELNYLVQRQYLIKSNTGKYIVGKKFKSMFINKFVASQEFWNLYPAFSDVTKQGKRLPLKIADVAVFREMYLSVIQGVHSNHQEIMIDLQYAIDNQIGLPSIIKFIQSAQWTEIRKLRTSKKDNNKSNNEINTIGDDDDF